MSMTNSSKALFYPILICLLSLALVAAAGATEQPATGNPAKDEAVKGEPVKHLSTGSTRDPRSYFEQKDNKIIVRYRDYPIAVKVSRDGINHFSVPYVIKSVDVSPDDVEDMTKGEREFSIWGAGDKKIPLSIVTAEKTFLLTLLPEDMAIVDVVIEDYGERKRSVEADESSANAGTLPSEIFDDPIRKALLGKPIEGYYENSVSRLHDSPDVLFVVKKEYQGVKYSVVVMDVINKTKDVLQLRADMQFLKYVISKVAGTPIAAALTREYLQPRSRDSEPWQEYKSTLIAVVHSTDKAR